MSPRPLAFLAIFVAGCSHFFVQRQPPPGGWCKERPTNFIAKHENGAIMARGSELEGGGTLVEVFDVDGNLRVTAQSPGPFVRTYTVFGANGIKQLEGTYREDAENERFIPIGIWRFFGEDGSRTLRAVFSGDVMIEHEGELSPEAFELHEAHALYRAPAEYPPEKLERLIEADTCTLLALDDQGKVTGLFVMDNAEPEFRQATYSAILRSKFAPMKIGELSFPSTVLQRYHFRIQ